MNSVNYDRNTALHLAATYGHIDAVRYLISIGVKINPENRWSSTPLNQAKNFPDVASLLIANGGYLVKELPVNVKLFQAYKKNSNLTIDDYR
jgi:glutaminase